MPPEPAIKRTISFVDGQNLYHSAREAFGYSFPNYDVTALGQKLCALKGWSPAGVRFYTGVPDATDDRFWNEFWNRKLLAMSRQGVKVFSRALRYRNKVVKLPDGTEHSFLAGEEKGIDVRLALDVIRAAHRNEFDVALMFSQDQDLSEVADEIRVISKEQNRWIKAACAFPSSPTSRNTRGVNGSDWIRIDRATYDLCIDKVDHRSARKQ